MTNPEYGRKWFCRSVASMTNICSWGTRFTIVPVLVCVIKIICLFIFILGLLHSFMYFTYYVHQKNPSLTFLYPFFVSSLVNWLNFYFPPLYWNFIFFFYSVGYCSVEKSCWTLPFRFLLLLYILFSSYPYSCFFGFYSHDCLPYFCCCYYFPIHFFLLLLFFEISCQLFALFLLSLYSQLILFSKVLYNILHILLIFCLLFPSLLPWLLSIWCRFCSLYLSFLFTSYILSPLSALFFIYSAAFDIFAALFSFTLPVMCFFRIFTLCNSMYLSSLFLVVFSSILSFFLFCWIFRMFFLGFFI